MSGYVGAILAAGRGSRMGPLGELYPKPLLPVANQPLIAHHIQTLRDLGIEDVYVVVGANADQIMQALGTGDKYGVRVTYVDQGAPLGSAHAVARLASYIDSPFVLLLGDYYFYAPRLQQMLENATSKQATYMAAKRDSDSRALREACVLQVNDEWRVSTIVEKPKVPRSDIKGCGIYICRPEFLDAVHRTPRTALRDEYELTVSLEIYVRMGGPLYAAPVIEWDRNFTRPEDVLECNLAWLRHEKNNQLVGGNTQIAVGTQLQQSVIGDDVTISQPCSLRNVVVFQGVRLEGGRQIERALVTPSRLIDCRG
jgi:NDP-sugar pyrophosphorylase family protein